MEKRLFCMVCEYDGWSHACDDCRSDADEFVLDESKLNDFRTIINHFDSEEAKVNGPVYKDLIPCKKCGKYPSILPYIDGGCSRENDFDILGYQCICGCNSNSDVKKIKMYKTVDKAKREWNMLNKED